MPAAVDVTSLPDELKKATSVFEMWELTGLAQTAVAERTEKVKASVDDVKQAVTTGGQGAVTAIDGVKTAVTDGAQRIARAIDELTIELKRLSPMFERAQFEAAAAAAAASVSREYEYFKISALEDATEATRAHLDQLEKTVSDAIRRERLAAFLEHIQRWEDPGPTTPQRRQKK